MHRLWWGGTTETGSNINVCTIYGIQFASMNYFLLGKATETVSQIKVCVIYGIQFTRMNYLRWAKRTEMVQLNKMCVIHGKQVCSQKCVGRPITTQTIPVNKPCVLWANDCWYTIVNDWWNQHRWVPLFSQCAMWFAQATQHLRSVYRASTYILK